MEIGMNKMYLLIQLWTFVFVEGKVIFLPTNIIFFEKNESNLRRISKNTCATFIRCGTPVLLIINIFKKFK